MVYQDVKHVEIQYNGATSVESGDTFDIRKNGVVIKTVNIPTFPSGGVLNARIDASFVLRGTIASSKFTATQYKALMEKCVSEGNPQDET